MPEFQLDTAGTIHNVRAPSIEPVKRVDLDFCDLGAFTQGYIEAMFFTSTGTGDDGDLEDATFADLAPETLASIVADCTAFLDRPFVNATLGAHVEMIGDLTRAGRDFWFTRNGHGVGFWDGDWPEPIGSEATALANEFHPVDLYRGDDGKLYLA